jgi:hypothetical protein
MWASRRILADKRSAIERAVDEQLAQKSLTKIEMDADLYVGYQAVEPKRCRAET